MEPLTLGNFFIETILFLFVVSVYFYLPGRWILTKLNLTNRSPEPFVLPVTLGIVFFVGLSYITSWIHALPLTLIPIVLIALSYRKNLPHIVFDKKHRISFTIVTALAILFSLPRTLGGIWGNTFSPVMDDTLHLSYIRELSAHFPPDHPGFAGTPLMGYHFFLDFLTASLSKLSFIPVTSLYFHYLPLLVSLSLAFGIYALIFLWTKRRDAGLWGVFLAMFGGSFGFILRLQGHPEVSLATVFGIDQPASAILNPPFAFSLLLVVATLILIYHYTQERKIGWLFLAAFFVGLSPMFKVYVGIVLFSGFFGLVGIELLRRRFVVLGPLFFAILLTLATYGVFSGPGNYLIFLPLWSPHRMLTANLPWYGFEEKYYTYTHLSVIRGIIDVEMYGLRLFILGNLGTRLFGVLIHGAAWLKRRKPLSVFAGVLGVMILTSILIPLFFIQSVKVFEIIQLAFYFPFLSALGAAYGLAKINDLSLPKLLRWIIITAIIAMTLPSTYEIFTSYVLSPKTRNIISPLSPERYLATHGTYDDTVLELPPEAVGNAKGQLVAWYRSTSAKFAAYANKRSFYNSTEVDFPNLDVQGRAEFLVRIRRLLSDGKTQKEQSVNFQKLTSELKNRKIVYLYSPYKLNLLETFSNTPVFMLGSVFIYKID